MSVTIGIDPHKSTHTAVAVDRDEQPIARLTLPATRCQSDRLLAWAEPLDVGSGVGDRVRCRAWSAARPTARRRR